MGRIVEDLHGNILECEEASFTSLEVCPQVIAKGERRIFTKDRVEGQGFILINFEDQYGYVFNVNGCYVYGLFRYIGYKQENDIRKQWQKKK